MNLLSIKQPYADLIKNGEKIYEIRSWTTKYRGPILICSSKRPNDIENIKEYGKTICIVDLLDVVKFNRCHEKGACIEYKENHYAWHFKLNRIVKNVDVIGKMGFFKNEEVLLKCS